MDALNVLGGIGAGINKGSEIALQQSSVEKDNAMKDFQLKKAQREEAFNSKIVPIESIWPQYKTMPKAYKSLLDIAGENGIKTEQGQIPGISIGSAKELMTLLGTRADMSKKFTSAMKEDLVSKHGDLTRMIESGVDEEGKSLKPDLLDSLKKERDTIARAVTQMQTLEHYTDLKKAEIQASKTFAKMTPFGEDKATGKQIMVDGRGDLYFANERDANGNPKRFTGDSSTVVPKAEMTRAVPTTATVIRVGGSEGDHRASDEKLYDRWKKDPGNEKRTFSDFLKFKAGLRPQGGIQMERPSVTGG